MALQRCLQKEGAPEEKLAKVRMQLRYQIKLKSVHSRICGPDVFLPAPLLDGLQASNHEDHLQPSHRQAGVFPPGAPRDDVRLPSLVPGGFRQ